MKNTLLIILFNIFILSGYSATNYLCPSIDQDGILITYLQRSYKKVSNAPIYEPSGEGRIYLYNRKTKKKELIFSDEVGIFSSLKINSNNKLILVNYAFDYPTNLYAYNYETKEKFNINLGMLQPKADEPMRFTNCSFSGDGNYMLFDSWAMDYVDDKIPADIHTTVIQNIHTGKYETILNAVRPSSNYNCSKVVYFDTSEIGKAKIYLYLSETKEKKLIETLYDQYGGRKSPLLKIDGKGENIIYTSYCKNNERSEISNVYLYNIPTKSVRLISKSLNSENANDSSGSHSIAISQNGQFVVFDSYASNLVKDDNNHTGDVFLYDTTSDKLEMISKNNNGKQLQSSSGNSISINKDGSYVVFDSHEEKFRDDYGSYPGIIYLYDREKNTIKKIP